MQIVHLYTLIFVIEYILYLVTQGTVSVVVLVCAFND
jgi:hypothetical protein